MQSKLRRATEERNDYPFAFEASSDDSNVPVDDSEKPFTKQTTDSSHPRTTATRVATCTQRALSRACELTQIGFADTGATATQCSMSTNSDAVSGV